MKNFKLKRLLGLAIVGGMAALHSSVALSAAGEDITNTATLTYDVGGIPTDVPSNETTFKEDRLLNFTVVTTDVASVPVAASATGQVTTFRVTNNGNGPQDFSLLAFNEATATDDPFVIGGDTDSFDATVTTIRVNSVIDAAGTFDGAGVDANTFIDELPAGSFVDVFVVSTIPTPPPVLGDSALSVVSLQAQIAVGGVAAAQGADITTDDFGNPDTAAEETVFLDAIGDSTIAADVANDGLDSDDSAYIISAAILTVVKSSVTLWDPVNLDVNPKAIPGAIVRFTIVVDNDALATASGDLTDLADPLIANLNLDFDFLDGVGATPAATSAVDDAVLIDTLADTSRPSAAVTYCTADGPDTDGCTGLAGSVAIDFTQLTASAAEDVAPVGAGPEDYTVGELKPGESITIQFNAIVQ